MLTLAVRAPVAEGLKVTVMVQLALTASVLGLSGQVFVWAKSPALVPVSPTLVMVRGAVPLLVSVTGWPALVVPVGWLPNERLVGERVTAGAVPVPLSATVCGLPPALSLMETLALRLPVAPGVKVTLMVQVALTASVLGLLGQ